MDEHEYYHNLPNPVAADQPDVLTVIARMIIRTRAAALFHPNLCPDVAGNLWFSATELTGNSTPHKVWKATPQGVITHVATVWPGDTHKGDGVKMRIMRDPATGEYYLGLLFTTHFPASGERDNDYQYAEVRGLGVAAPATGEGIDFDSRALGQGGNSEPSLTEEQVKAAVLAALREALVATTNGALFGRWQKAAENGAKVGLREDGVLTTANMGAAYAASYQVQQQLDNRVYAVLRDQRVLEAVAKILGSAPEAPTRDLANIPTPAEVAALADQERAAWEAAALAELAATAALAKSQENE